MKKNGILIFILVVLLAVFLTTTCIFYKKTAEYKEKLRNKSR